MKFENSVLINRPVETVFDYVTDVRNNAHWQSGVISIDPTSDQPAGLGSTFRCVNRFLGLRLETETIVTAYQHPLKCAFKITSGMVSGESSFLFAAVNGATKFTTVGELNLDYFKLANYLVARRARLQLIRDMKTLKQILEKKQS